MGHDHLSPRRRDRPVRATFSKAFPRHAQFVVGPPKRRDPVKVLCSHCGRKTSNLDKANSHCGYMDADGVCCPGFFRIV